MPEIRLVFRRQIPAVRFESNVQAVLFRFVKNQGEVEGARLEENEKEFEEVWEASTIRIWLSDVLKGLSFLLNCIRIEYSRVA
jgi:hypothetical protein